MGSYWVHVVHTETKVWEEIYETVQADSEEEAEALAEETFQIAKSQGDIDPWYTDDHEILVDENAE